MIRSFTLFALAGLASAFTYFATLYLLEHGWGLDYRVAVTLSYGASVATHFLLNRHVTFAASGAAALRDQLPRYLVLVGMNYLINLAIVIACVEWLGWTSAQGVLLSMPVTLAAGYVLARVWVFQPENKKA